MPSATRKVTKNDLTELGNKLATALDELMQSEGNEPRTDPDNSPNVEEWNQARQALHAWRNRNAW